MPTKSFFSVPVIYCVAGGTGGHVFPAMTLTNALEQQGYNVCLIVDHRAKKWLYNHKYNNFVTHRVVSAAGIIGKHWFDRIKALVRLSLGYLQSCIWLWQDRPTLVIGFGGYTSLPVLLAAQHFSYHTIIHEQNVLMGRVNRILARRADCILLSFSETHAIPKQIFSSATTCLVTGNPLLISTYTKFFTFHISNKIAKRKMLVLGGSLGSKFFNTIIPAALSLLSEEQREHLFLWHQADENVIDSLLQCYTKMGIEAECSPFFHGAVDLMTQAKVLICRAGGTTCAEIVATSTPAIIIPLPHSSDNHQWYNAEFLYRFGGAYLLEQHTLSASDLSQCIINLLDNKHDKATFMKKVLKNLCYDEPLNNIVRIIQSLST